MENKQSVSAETPAQWEMEFIRECIEAGHASFSMLAKWYSYTSDEERQAYAPKVAEQLIHAGNMLQAELKSKDHTLDYWSERFVQLKDAWNGADDNDQALDALRLFLKANDELSDEALSDRAGLRFRINQLMQDKEELLAALNTRIDQYDAAVQRVEKLEMELAVTKEKLDKEIKHTSYIDELLNGRVLMTMVKCGAATPVEGYAKAPYLLPGDIERLISDWKDARTELRNAYLDVLSQRNNAEDINDITDDTFPEQRVAELASLFDRLWNEYNLERDEEVVEAEA